MRELAMTTVNVGMRAAREPALQMRSTRSAAVIANLMAANPAARRDGFRSAILHLLPNDPRLSRSGFAFLPDAYEIDHERNVVRLIEVVDTHPIHPDKGCLFAWLSAVLYQNGWGLSASVFDYCGAIIAVVPGWAYHPNNVARFLHSRSMDATPAAKAYMRSL